MKFDDNDDDGDDKADSLKHVRVFTINVTLLI